MKQSAVVLALSLLTALFVLVQRDRSSWGERADAGFTPPAGAH
jgi:hypothetical protein